MVNQGGVMKGFVKFIVICVIIYFILSLPMILGLGIAIDFVEGVSWLRKAKRYFITGIEYGYLSKILISLVASTALAVLLKIKKK